jgi:hypothetical protein
MWKKYFTIKNGTPNRFKVPKIGEFNLQSETLSIFKLKALIDRGFDFVNLTDEGKSFFEKNPYTWKESNCGCA